MSTGAVSLLCFARSSKCLPFCRGVSSVPGRSLGAPGDEASTETVLWGFVGGGGCSEEGKEAVGVEVRWTTRMLSQGRVWFRGRCERDLVRESFPHR